MRRQARATRTDKLRSSNAAARQELRWPSTSRIERGVRRRYRLRSPVDPRADRRARVHGRRPTSRARSSARARRSRPGRRSRSRERAAGAAAACLRARAREAGPDHRDGDARDRQDRDRGLRDGGLRDAATRSATTRRTPSASCGPRRERIHGVLGLAKQLRLVYKPLGVVGIIVPWNGPFVLGDEPGRAGADGRQRRAAEGLRGDAVLDARWSASSSARRACPTACSRC